MKELIEKAIEGGYKPLNWFNPYTAESRGLLSDGTEIIALYNVNGGRTTVNTLQLVMSPLFWQALFPQTSCTHSDGEIYRHPAKCEQGKYYWEYNALKFHEINLTQGFEKAVEYIITNLK